MISSKNSNTGPASFILRTDSMFPDTTTDDPLFMKLRNSLLDSTTYFFSCFLCVLSAMTACRILVKFPKTVAWSASNYLLKIVFVSIPFQKYFHFLFITLFLGIIAKDCFLTLVKSRLLLGSPGWSVGCFHAENGLIHRKMVGDLITSIGDTIFQTRLDQE